MLMHNDRLSDYKWIEVYYELSKVLNQVYQGLDKEHILMEYLQSLTRLELV